MIGFSGVYYVKKKSNIYNYAQTVMLSIGAYTVLTDNSEPCPPTDSDVFSFTIGWNTLVVACMPFSHISYVKLTISSLTRLWGNRPWVFTPIKSPCQGR